MPDFFLNPVALTAKEASCLIQAAEIFRASVGEKYEQDIESAVSKIMARLPEETKKRAAALCEEAGISMEEGMFRMQELTSAS